MSFLLPQLHLPSVCDPHDALTFYYRQAAQRAATLPTKVARSIQMVNSSLKDRFLLPHAARILVVSKAESARMPVSLVHLVEVIPLGVDLKYFTPRPSRPSEDEEKVLFFGDLSYAPNVEGLLHFMSEVLPLVKRTHPRVTLDVVGRNPSRWLVDMVRKASINLYADVPDVRPYIAQSDVCVVPVYFGTGTRNKVLEAMAMGKAVVTTTQGSEGIMAESGSALLVANDDMEFASHVSRALSDHDWSYEIGTEARKAVTWNHDWSTLAIRLDRMITALSLKGTVEKV
jgi:glycosyltransferase involved in cell wall biosynthesis